MGDKAVAKKAKPKVSLRIKSFFRGVWAELKKVNWPTRRQVLVYTGIVLAAIFSIAVAIWAVDSVLTFLMSLLFK